MRQIEHALNVRGTGNVRLDGSLPKLVSEGLCTVTIQVRQQQLRAILCHASSTRGADATRSARDERMNAVQPISHLTSASYRCTTRGKRSWNGASTGGELFGERLQTNETPASLAAVRAPQAATRPRRRQQA
jgi:hypothetical protein